MSNKYAEQIFNAIEIIANKKISGLKYDKTIKGKIVQIVNLNTGEYRVEYSGGIFLAYSQDLTKKYKVNDEVYVNIPEGDYSGRKLIVSKASDQSLSESQLTSLRNSVFEVSPSFETIYNVFFNEPAGVIAGAPAGSVNSTAYVCNELNDKTNGLFLQYANNYEHIRIKGSFSTKFHDLHTRGNYGIEVEFWANDGTVVPYRLDFQNFNGDPYSFSVYSEQSVIVKVQKGYLLGLKSIKLFEEDFAYDKIYSYDLNENNEVIKTSKENKTSNNIFVKDVSIQYVDIKDLSDSTYHLIISPLKGIAFNSRVTTLQMQGRLVYEGEDIINQADSCQWFVRDVDVVIGSSDYNKDAGVAWKPISGATESRLDISNTSVRKQEEYKLLVYYKDVVSTAEIEVFNLNNSIEYSLEQVTVDNNESIALRITNPNLTGYWYALYPDGAYIAVDNGAKVNSIIINPYLQYSSIVFYVEVHDTFGKLGTLRHTITSSENEEDISVTYIGEDTFRYNANGDIAIEDSERERTLQAQLAWKDGAAVGYTISWTLRDGTELPRTKETAITPPDSMLENLWVDNYNILHYNLRQKYKISLTNNTVCIKIKTVTQNSQTYYFEKEILCLKDGDQGTNGTTYIAAVRPCDSSGVKLAGFQCLRYNGGWQETMQVRCYVYKDGELINGNSNYNIRYKWRGYNISVNNQTSLSGTTDRVTIRGLNSISASTPAANLAFYVKIQVDIDDREKGKSVSIYASYPIDVLVGPALTKRDVDIADIPSYIKYTASGVTPLFYDEGLNFYFQNVAYNNNITSLNENLLTIVTDKYGKKHLNPVGSFIYENILQNNESNIGVLQLTLPGSRGRIIHPVIMYLDTYGNEAINGWDGTALDTGNGEYVFAPQIGAGEKDNANRFTGVVMGKDTIQNLIGLYGYQAGVNTFGLMQDGRAFFGAKAGGGQIIIDGYSGIISGGDVVVSATGNITPAANGMYLRLADKKITGSTKAIGIGYDTHDNANGRPVTEENFYVTYDGKLKATEADIQGVIYAVKGQIGGTERSGGWTIETNRLYSGSGSTRVELNSDPDEIYAIWAGKTSGADAKRNTFAVTKTGELFAKVGDIGGWTLGPTSLTSSNNRVGLASSGVYAFWAGANVGTPGDTPVGAVFSVTRDGALTSTSGEIGGWVIKEGSLSAYNGRVQLLSDDPDQVAIRTTYGDIGLVKGRDDNGATYNFGMIGNNSTIIQAANNAALRGNNIYLDSNTLTATAPANKQFGIYARFA